MSAVQPGEPRRRGAPLRPTLPAPLSVLEPTWAGYAACGAAWLGWIGSTRSLFISVLAYGGGSVLALAEIGVLVASVVEGVGGYLTL